MPRSVVVGRRPRPEWPSTECRVRPAGRSHTAGRRSPPSRWRSPRRGAARPTVEAVPSVRPRRPRPTADRVSASQRRARRGDASAVDETQVRPSPGGRRPVGTASSPSPDDGHLETDARGARRHDRQPRTPSRAAEPAGREAASWPGPVGRRRARRGSPPETATRRSGGQATLRPRRLGGRNAASSPRAGSRRATVARRRDASPVADGLRRSPTAAARHAPSVTESAMPCVDPRRRSASVTRAYLASRSAIARPQRLDGRRCRASASATRRARRWSRLAIGGVARRRAARPDRRAPGRSSRVGAGRPRCARRR